MQSLLLGHAGLLTPALARSGTLWTCYEAKSN